MTDEQKISAAANEHGLARSKFIHERIGRKTITGSDDRPWDNKPDHHAVGSFRCGVTWRDQNPSPEVLAVIEAAKKYLLSRKVVDKELDWDALEALELSLAQFEAKRKGK